MIGARAFRVGEAGLGAGVLGLGVFLAVETARLRIPPSYASVGPTLFPYLIAGGLVVIGVLLLRQAFAGHVAHESGRFELDWWACGLVAAGLVLQFLLLETIGWIPAATLLFVVAARAFGSRRLVKDVLIGVVLTGLAFILFGQVLGLSLPTGTVIEHLLGDDADDDAGG